MRRRRGGLIRDRLSRARECAEGERRRVRTETEGLWWQMRIRQEPLWVLLTALQITTGVLGNHCGEATCVRHRLEQLRRFGAQTLLDVQSRISRTLLRAARRQGDRSGWFELELLFFDQRATLTQEDQLKGSKVFIILELNKTQEISIIDQYWLWKHLRKTRLQGCENDAFGC